VSVACAADWAGRLLAFEAKLCVAYVKQVYNQQLALLKKQKTLQHVSAIVYSHLQQCQYCNTYTAFLYSLTCVDGNIYVKWQQNIKTYMYSVM
jgi:hypothetical protein